MGPSFSLVVIQYVSVILLLCRFDVSSPIVSSSLSPVPSEGKLDPPVTITMRNKKVVFLTSSTIVAEVNLTKTGLSYGHLPAEAIFSWTNMRKPHFFHKQSLSVSEILIWQKRCSPSFVSCNSSSKLERIISHRISHYSVFYFITLANCLLPLEEISRKTLIINY